MKEKIYLLFTISCLVLALGWASNRALTYYDPPKEVYWEEYRVPRDMYLWQVASELSNQFRRHPDTLVKAMEEKNHLGDNYLREGQTILIPQKFLGPK
jgi:hypothetical protein